MTTNDMTFGYSSHDYRLLYYSNFKLSEDTLKNDNLTMNLQVDLQDLCNGVIHLITKKTLTNYEKVIECPKLRERWIKAMFKELGNIAQGYSDGKISMKKE